MWPKLITRLILGQCDKDKLIHRLTEQIKPATFEATSVAGANFLVHQCTTWPIKTPHLQILKGNSLSTKAN